MVSTGTTTKMFVFLASSPHPLFWCLAYGSPVFKSLNALGIRDELILMMPLNFHNLLMIFLSTDS